MVNAAKIVGMGRQNGSGVLRIIDTSCIALRCAVLKNQKVYFQAGAGIVADSDPQQEYEETVIKAQAMMKALAMASEIKMR